MDHLDSTHPGTFAGRRAQPGEDDVPGTVWAQYQRAASRRFFNPNFYTDAMADMRQREDVWGGHLDAQLGGRAVRLGLGPGPEMGLEIGHSIGVGTVGVEKNPRFAEEAHDYHAVLYPDCDLGCVFYEADVVEVGDILSQEGISGWASGHLEGRYGLPGILNRSQMERVADAAAEFGLPFAINTYLGHPRATAHRQDSYRKIYPGEDIDVVRTSEGVALQGRAGDGIYSVARPLSFYGQMMAARGFVPLEAVGLGSMAVGCLYVPGSAEAELREKFGSVDPPR